MLSRCKRGGCVPLPGLVRCQASCNRGFYEEVRFGLSAAWDRGSGSSHRGLARREDSCRKKGQARSSVPR